RTNVNHELVKEDWCWWYRKYAPGDTVLEGLETKAREAKKGLWADPRPVPPWEWRNRPSNTNSKFELTALTRYSGPSFSHSSATVSATVRNLLQSHSVIMLRGLTHGSCKIICHSVTLYHHPSYAP